MLKFRTYHIQYDDFFNSLEIWCDWNSFFFIKWLCIDQNQIFSSQNFTKNLHRKFTCWQSKADARRSQNCGIAWGHVPFTPFKGREGLPIEAPKAVWLAGRISRAADSARGSVCSTPRVFSKKASLPLTAMERTHFKADKPDSRPQCAQRFLPWDLLGSSVNRLPR